MISRNNMKILQIVMHCLPREIDQLERILDKFQDRFSDPNTVFYDIGSGYGKMVMHVASVAPIKKCVGVEFIKERNDFAIKESLKYKYKSQQKPSFIQGDAFKLSYDDATIVYSDTTASGFKDAFREHLVPMLPSGCILIMRGDPGDLVDIKGTFKSETTYFKNYFARWGVVR